MSLTILPVGSDRTVVLQLSWLRCPRTQCADYGKRLFLEVGQHETEGDLRLRHWCVCGYQETSTGSPSVAARTSPILARVRDKVRRGRDDSVEVPMHYDTEPFPAGEFDAS